MLVIRFRRIGKKNKPTYRLTVAEHTKPVNGSFVSDVGFYNPHTKVAGLKGDEILDWLKKGAKPSNSVAKLFKREKIKHASVVVIKKNKKAKTEKKDEKPAVPVASAEKNEEVIETNESTEGEVAGEPAEETPAENSEEVPIEESKEEPTPEEPAPEEEKAE